MKTPIQKLIENIRDAKLYVSYEKEEFYDTFIEMAEAMLEEEKKYITKTYLEGFDRASQKALASIERMNSKLDEQLNILKSEN